MHASPADASVKWAELLSTVGAGVMGGGIGLLLVNQLADDAVAILALGLVAHGVGMYRKHALEQGRGDTPVWWHVVLYWVCWLALGGFLLYIISRLV